MLQKSNKKKLSKKNSIKFILFDLNCSTQKVCKLLFPKLTAVCLIFRYHEINPFNVMTNVLNNATSFVEIVHRSPESIKNAVGEMADNSADPY
jgi:hypothetical protein